MAGGSPVLVRLVNWWRKKPTLSCSAQSARAYRLRLPMPPV